MYAEPRYLLEKSLLGLQKNLLEFEKYGVKYFFFYLINYTLALHQDCALIAET